MAPSLPPIVGPGECGIEDVVQLEAVMLPDKTRVAVTPPATCAAPWPRRSCNGCATTWRRRCAQLGAPLKSLDNYASYDCRGRNRVVGAKMSEHGKANALDMRSLRLADGKVVGLTDPQVAKDFREELRKAACARFTTVLGPGSDGYHENHMHVDLAERRSGHRMCQWDVRELADEPAAAPPRCRCHGRGRRRACSGRWRCAGAVPDLPKAKRRRAPARRRLPAPSSVSLVVRTGRRCHRAAD